jgi:hypothetical protein
MYRSSVVEIEPIKDVDVLSAYERWKDGKTLNPPATEGSELDFGFEDQPVDEDVGSLDFGFPPSDDEPPTPEVHEDIDMQFPPTPESVDDLDLGFPLDPSPNDGTSPARYDWNVSKSVGQFSKWC